MAMTIETQALDLYMRQARRVTVAARREDATFVLEVIDDGRGFDPGSEDRSDWPRFGLETMRERAASVSGTVEIESRPGAGTRVRFRLPVSVDAR